MAVRICAAIIMSVWLAPSASAEEIITTPTEPQLTVSPLVITSYKTRNNGTDIEFV